MRDLKSAVGVACQLAFDYDDCSQEHISDMYNTYQDCGDKPPCSYNDLEDLTYEAMKLRQEEKTWDEAEKIMLEKHSKKSRKPKKS